MDEPETAVARANGAAPAKRTNAQREPLRLWLKLLACTVQIENELGARLRKSFGTTLARFDLLAQLARFPQGLRMGELSRRLMVTGANVTVLTDQLESDGLVKRTSDPDDRRANVVTLTAKGQRAFAQMADVHASWVNELFGTLNKTEQTQLAGLLAKLKTGLGVPSDIH
jgi:DNA-binding MarR family transcriptional regulator